VRTDKIAIDAELKKRESIRDQILLMCPELAEDDEVLTDTLDGETDIDEIVITLAKAIKEREASKAACKELARMYSDRAARMDKTAAGMKELIAWTLQRAGKKSVKHLLGTVSWRPLEDKVVIVDKEPGVADPMFVSERTVVEYDIEKVKAHLEDAIDAGIAVIQNDRKSVTIRI